MGTSWLTRAINTVRGILGRASGAVARRVTASGGIDDTKLPSGFEAPYRRGSRMVRNLWHIPF